MLIGSAGLQIPSVLSHVFKTGWGAELLNFFFASGGQAWKWLETTCELSWVVSGKFCVNNVAHLKVAQYTAHLSVHVIQTESGLH